jgi:hypothetical protein
MGDSYKLYLKDTSILQHKHIDALKKESNKLMKLLGSNKNILPNIVPEDDDMGEYIYIFFCMLASHNGVVITTRLVALSYVLLLQPLVTRSIHA